MESGFKAAITDQMIGTWLCCGVLIRRDTNGAPFTDEWHVEGQKCKGRDETWVAFAQTLKARYTPVPVPKKKRVPTTPFRVYVSFTGMIEVLVPKSVPAERRLDLAEKKALAVVVATLDNPDAPEDDACCEYQEQHALTKTRANREWDTTELDSVSGSWTAVDTVESGK